MTTEKVVLVTEPEVGVGEIEAAELAALRASVRGLLAASCPETGVRAAIERGRHDPRLWNSLTAELGLAALAIPARFGGDGFGMPVLRVVLEEQGRALLPAPFLASAVLAAQALLASRDAAACTRWLPRIAAGSLIATVAVAEKDGAWDPVLTRTLATPTSVGNWTLSGHKFFVLDAQVADLILVVGRSRGGPSLFAVHRGAPGLTVTPMRTLDGTRPMAQVRLEDAPAELIGTPATAAGVVRRVVDLGGLALAAEQVGASRRCLELSVAYAKERSQFGRPIGSFQAVKHKLADMLVRIELADALTEGACLLAAQDSPEGAAAAVAAHIVASEAFRVVAADTIQIHGGIGFTWEHAAHLYYRRAEASERLFGGPALHHERFLDRLGI